MEENPRVAPNASEVRKPARSKAGDRKRTRTPLACDLCRERKVRCNGAKPVCGRCQMRGLNESQCVYSTIMNSIRIDSQREYIKALHDRIRHLERARGSFDVHSEPTGSERSRGNELLVENSLVRSENIEQSRPPTEKPLSQVAAASNSKGPQSTSLLQHSDSASSNISGNIHSPAFSGGFVVEGQVLREVGTSIAPVVSPYGNHNTTVSFDTINSSASVEEEEQFNAMGVIYSGKSHHQIPSQTFYGQSSVASLLNQIGSQPARIEDSRRQESRRLPPFRFAPGNASIPQPSMSSSSRRAHWSPLPPRHVADDLLNHYWSGVHLYYPWVHKESFLKSYESIWSPIGAKQPAHSLPRIGLGGSDCSDTVFNFALNAIFALGCQFSDTTRDQLEDPASEFIERAFNLLHVELLDTANLALVQTLLLVALYLQSTQQVMRTWSMAGLAGRMAIGIGLHLSHEDSKYSFFEIEMRRRAWHGCMLIDRIVSMTLGRFPLLLGAPKVPLFSAIDDEYLINGSEVSSQPDCKFSRVTFAVENVKLGWILGDILQYLYNNHLECEGRKMDSVNKRQLSQNSTFDSLVALESSLTEFEANLPKQLRWNDQTESDVDCLPEKPFIRQRYVLRARALHTRLMLYRPSFSKFCGRVAPNKTRFERGIPTSGSKGKNIGCIFEFHCALACFHSAGDMIELLYKAVSEDLWGAWWFALYYLVSSMIILIIAESRTNLKDEIEEGQLTSWWRLYLRSTEIISSRHPTADQCLIALQAIRQRALGTREAAILTSRQPSHGPRNQGRWNQELTDEQRKDVDGDWNIETPVQEPFPSLAEMDFEHRNSEIGGGFTPPFESLQNFFGNAIASGTIMDALDMDCNNWFS